MGTNQFFTNHITNLFYFKIIIKLAKARLSTFDGNNIKVKGKCKLIMQINEEENNIANFLS